MNNNTLKTAPLFLFDADKNIHEFYNTLEHLNWMTVKDCFEDIASYYYAENNLYVIRMKDVKDSKVYSLFFSRANNPKTAIIQAKEKFQNAKIVPFIPKILEIIEALVEWDVAYPVGDDTGKGLRELDEIIARAKSILERFKENE